MLLFFADRSSPQGVNADPVHPDPLTGKHSFLLHGTHPSEEGCNTPLWSRVSRLPDAYAWDMANRPLKEFRND